MRDFALDPTTGDLDLTSGGIVLTEGKNTTRQRLEGRLSLALEDWFLDLSLGFPYQRDVFRRHAPRSLSLLESTFRRCITPCPGVKSLETLTLRRTASRGLLVNFVVRDVDGETIEVNDFAPGGV